MTAFNKFATAHENAQPLQWGIVTIQKKPMVPLRLFREYRGTMSQPFPGSFFLQGKNVGFLSNTGVPSLRQGTPNPIRLELVEKSAAYNLELQVILRDVFWLSQLNWNSPEININLPITLRFTDQKLERFALEMDEDSEGDDDWDTEKD